jgi:hypothetical protein
LAEKVDSEQWMIIATAYVGTQGFVDVRRQSLQGQVMTWLAAKTFFKKVGRGLPSTGNTSPLLVIRLL